MILADAIAQDNFLKRTHKITEKKGIFFFFFRIKKINKKKKPNTFHFETKNCEKGKKENCFCKKKILLALGKT